MSDLESAVKYPECEVQLVGVDENAVAIFRKVRKELIRYLVDEKGMARADATQEGDAFQAEATSGDYNNMFATCERWVTIC